MAANITMTMTRPARTRRILFKGGMIVSCEVGAPSSRLNMSKWALGMNILNCAFARRCSRQSVQSWRWEMDGPALNGQYTGRVCSNYLGRMVQGKGLIHHATNASTSNSRKASMTMAVLSTEFSWPLQPLLKERWSITCRNATLKLELPCLTSL